MKYFAAAIVMILLSATNIVQAHDIRNERVRFKPGATSATIEASIKGYEIVDYILNAKAGQF